MRRPSVIWDFPLEVILLDGTRNAVNSPSQEMRVPHTDDVQTECSNFPQSPIGIALCSVRIRTADWWL